MINMFKRLAAVMSGSVLTAALLVGGATAASSNTLDVSFTTVAEPVASETEATGEPIILEFTSLATAFANGGPSSSDSDIVGSHPFVKLADGTGCMQLKYLPFDQTVDDYRVMFYVNKGLITDAHKYMRVTYMTNDTTPAAASVIAKQGQPKAILSYDTSAVTGQWTRTGVADVSSNGTLERLKNGSSVILQFSNTKQDIELYVKEIAFFTSYEQAFTHYGDEVSYNSNDYYTMTFGEGSNSEVREYEENGNKHIWGNNSVDANGVLNISYAEKTNMNTHYMAKIKFNTKNALPDTYAFIRILYSAKNPADTSGAIMYFQCDGGSSILPIQKNIADTNGKLVLSDAAYLAPDMMQRLAATSAKKTNQHISLNINAAKDGGLYSIKAIYFFPTRAAAEGFELTNTQTTVKIGDNDISKYQIVISDNAPDVIVRSAQAFADYVGSLIGVTLPVVTDKTAESAYEILIGNSDRVKSTEFLAKYDLTADTRFFATELIGDTLVMNAADAYGVMDAVESVLSDYLYKGVNQIPKKLQITAPCINTGISVNMKPTDLHTIPKRNVEDPIVFTEDFDVDDGYFTEEDNTSDWTYTGGEYTTKAGNKRNLSYVHVYESNVDCTAKLRYTSAGDEGDMGLLLRYTGEYANAKAGYDFKTGEWYIEYREGEDFYTHRIASAKATLTVGKQYTVRFILDGYNADLYVDGVHLLTSTKMKHITPGRIAVCAENAAVSVDDVKAVLLSGEGTVLGGIYHTNLEKGVGANGASFIELSDNSVYLHVPSYETGYISRDGGQSWTKTEDILGIGKTYAHPLVLIDGTLLQIKAESGNIVAYTSVNNGKTWTKAGTVCPVTVQDSFAVSNMNDKVMQFPNTGRIVYAASTSANGDTAHISFYFYSDDNGKTWSRYDFTNRDIVGLQDIDRFAESKMIECADGSLRVYVTWGGMFGCMHYFESTDGGKTWGPNTLMPEMYAPSSSYQIVRDPYGETEHTYYMVWVYAKPTALPSIVNRSRLALAKTTDGKNWEYLGDIWRWETAYNHHNTSYNLNQIVNPSIGISKDALFISTGISERLRPDGNKTTHGDQQNHIWVIKRDFIPEGKPMNQFTDVKIGARYYDAVTYVANKGLFTGTSETTFAPDVVMNRSMFATVLGRLEGIDVSKYTKVSFSDVEAGSWYASYVEWAASTGVVNGIGGGLFGTDDPLTVETACVMLARYAKNKSAALATGLHASSFADAASVSSWATEGVEWALANGIYTGQNGTIKGQAQASRALVATMLYNFVNVFGE